TPFSSLHMLGREPNRTRHSLRPYSYRTCPPSPFGRTHILRALWRTPMKWAMRTLTPSILVLIRVSVRESRDFLDSDLCSSEPPVQPAWLKSNHCTRPPP